METQTLKKPGRPKKKQTQAPHLNQITVHLPPELVSALDYALEARGVRSRSELIREACQAYLKPHAGPAETVSLARQMQTFSREERQKMMSAAAAALSEYYQADPEMQEWQALEAEDFHDAAD